MAFTKRNRKHRELLNPKTLAKYPDAARRDVALDALLQVTLKPLDDDRRKAFDKALETHAAFWKEVTDDADFFQDDHDNSVTIDLEADRLFEDDSYLLLKQQAAEARVTFGLQNAATSTLVNILVHNDDACRAYLAEKNLLGDINKNKDWGTNEALIPSKPAQNKSTDILPDSAIDRIKEEARNNLLIKLMENPDANKEHVNELLRAKDHHEIQTAAKKLPGLDLRVLNQLRYPLSESVRHRGAIVVYKNYVQGLSDADILEKESNLRERPSAFVDTIALGNQLQNDLQFDNGVAAQGILGARYLQVFLSTRIGKKELSSLINTADADLAQAIDRYIDPAQSEDADVYDYITNAVQSAPSTIKKALLQGIINSVGNDPEDLSALSVIRTENNLEKIKTGLKGLGIDNSDWIKDADLPEIKKWSRAKLFEMQLNAASRFGAEAHPNLVKAFSNLNPDKQNGLLTKPQELSRLLNATKNDEIEAILGVGAAVVAEIVTENDRLALYKQINNVTIARGLESLKEILRENEVQAINQLIDRMGPDYLKLPKYANFLEEIAQAFGWPDGQGQIDKAFGLNEERDGLIADAPFKPDSILAQHQYNEHLLAAANNPAETRNKDLINLLITVEKDKPLSNADIDTLNTAFTNSANLGAFLAKIPDADPFKKLKVGLTNELTSDAFDEMKQLARTSAFQKKVDKASRFGIEAHPDLVEVFKQLPQAQQKLLLENEANIRHLLNARDPSAVKFYLGKELNEGLVNRVLNENLNLAKFQQINNAGVANILMNMKPLVILTNDNIVAINKVIEELKDDEFPLIIPFTKYKVFVEKIGKACDKGSPLSADFYKAFGLDLGTNRGTVKIINSIKDQHEVNKGLNSIAKSDRGPSNRELLNILLRIEKKATYTTQDFDDLSNKLRNSKSLKEFFKDPIFNKPPHQAIKADLEKELTSTSYDKIKIQRDAGFIITTASTPVVTEVIKLINKDLNDIIESRTAFDKTKKKYAILDKINTLHLCDPALQSKPLREKMKKEYQADADDCAVIIDQLTRNRAQLKAYQENLPKPLDIHPLSRRPAALDLIKPARDGSASNT